MTLKDIIAVHFWNRVKCINRMCGQNTDATL